MNTGKLFFIGVIIMSVSLTSCRKDPNVPTGTVFNAELSVSGTYNGHDYVDLGLPSGTLWATCNVGADSPRQYGDYYAWGETQPKDYYDLITYKYNNDDSLHIKLTKYCYDSAYGYNGFTDTLTILLPEDDAATVNWGYGWCMPNEAQWQELKNNTTCKWTTYNSIRGRLFTAANGNSLFLPAAGCYHEKYISFVKNNGNYWSSSIWPHHPAGAWDFGFTSDYYDLEGFARECGLSVRPVRSFGQNTDSFTVSVSTNPTDGGTVTGGDTYKQGVQCTVSAEANTGYNFINWTENGNVVSTNASYTFIVNNNRTLVANFQMQSYTISVSANPTNGGTVIGAGTYNYGESCSLHATAANGYPFINWTENGSVVSTNATYTFTVNADRSLVANFITSSEGSGTADDPYNVAAGIGLQNDEPIAWVHGYIVGAVKSGLTSVSGNADINWSAPFNLATNVVIADDASCHEISQCIIVNLPAGKPLRAQVNLMDHPDNLGKHLAVIGKLRMYYGQAGLRDSNGTEADFVLEP